MELVHCHFIAWFISCDNGEFYLSITSVKYVYMTESSWNFMHMILKWAFWVQRWIFPLLRCVTLIIKRNKDYLSVYKRFIFYQNLKDFGPKLKLNKMEWHGRYWNENIIFIGPSCSYMIRKYRCTRTQINFVILLGVLWDAQLNT